MPVFGEPLYGGPIEPERLALWKERCLNAGVPGYYQGSQAAEIEANRDFWGRAFTVLAEELAATDRLLDNFDLLLYAESAPEEWIDWLLQELFGWTLIPEGYPLARKRRLLYRDTTHNLALHYQRRYTKAGIKELLREFGIIANVYDRPIYVGSYLGDYGVTSPLNIWVRVLYYEPWESPQNNYVGSYMGMYAYRTHSIITNAFVAALCEWERAAGVRMIIEYVTASNRSRALVSLYGEATEIETEQPTTQEENITE